MLGELWLNVLKLLYLFLCQASVADPAIPGRPDDGAAWEEEMKRGGEKGGVRGENKSRARAPGNVGITQHILTLTDAFLKAQITGLHWGHFAVSTELLLSINAYYQHTHIRITAHIQFKGEGERERCASYLQLMNYVWAQQEMEKWREESETIASPYQDLKEKDKSGEVWQRNWEFCLEVWGASKTETKEEKNWKKSLIPSTIALFGPLSACGFDRFPNIPMKRS